jgi:hypothetical protein
MVLERERAEKMGYADPIHPTIEATHACYDAAIKTVMDRSVSSPLPSSSLCPSISPPSSLYLHFLEVSLSNNTRMLQ